MIGNDDMRTMTESELRAGIIFGDNASGEYVYMPGSELGTDEPLCVYEYGFCRDDISMKAAQDIVRRRSLKPVKHPRLGDNSF